MNRTSIRSSSVEQKPLKVLVVGGLARSLINFRGTLISKLIGRGCEVVTAAPNATPAQIRELKALGAGYRHVAIYRAGLNPLRDLKTVRDLHSLMVDETPDVLIAYTIKPIIYSGFAGRARSAPAMFALVTGLGYSFGVTEGLKQLLVGALTKRMYSLALERYAGILFQNVDDLADFRAAGLVGGHLRQGVVNGSGVDLGRFSQEELPARPSFLMIARLLREKGVYEYIEAARMVKKRFPNVRFRLVGAIDPNPSSLSKEQLAAVAEEGIVEYMGRLEDVRPSLADCSVYVLPSYREGTPRTVLEAMATGRGVVTTDVPGCRETVINGVNGFLIPPRDARSLADAMERFLEEPRLIVEMGRQSRVLAQRKFDAELVAEDIANFVINYANDKTPAAGAL